VKYKTVKDEITVKNVIKRSTFIGHVKQVKDKSEVEEFISKIRNNYSDANHNPYAYRLIDGSFYFSDDGEPSRSSGLPIFNAIRANEVFDVVVVVTRYFGGIKLGIPGLIEAYSSTADFAIKSAGIIETTTKKIVELTLPYKSLDYFHYALGKVNHKIIERNFIEIVKIKIEIDEDDFEKFKELLKRDSDILVNF